MKKLLITCTMLLAISAAKAQSYRGGENNRGRHKVEMPQDNEFANTEISMESRTISFTDLPDLPKPTWAIITDANGEVITQKRVTPTNSYMSARSLSRGDLYFLTLIYKNKSQKGFVLHP
jgi:hypothetical protein